MGWLGVSRASMAAVFVMILVLSGFASGSSALTLSAIDVLPTPEELPKNVVAVISHVPLKWRTVTTAELHRAIEQSAVDLGLESPPNPGQPKYEAVEEAALGGQLEGIWLQGQAREMGIVVTRREVANEFAQIKKENFKTEKQYHAFLEHSHLTQREALYRVKLQLLSTKMEERFSTKAFMGFVTAYEKRWRARTVCSTQFATKRCSNGSAPVETVPPSN
jgi:hypothetical protein